MMNVSELGCILFAIMAAVLNRANDTTHTCDIISGVFLLISCVFFTVIVLMRKVKTDFAIVVYETYFALPFAVLALQYGYSSFFFRLPTFLLLITIALIGCLKCYRSVKPFVFKLIFTALTVIAVVSGGVWFNMIFSGGLTRFGVYTSVAFILSFVISRIMYYSLRKT